MAHTLACRDSCCCCLMTLYTPVMFKGRDCCLHGCCGSSLGAECGLLLRESLLRQPLGPGASAWAFPAFLLEAFAGDAYLRGAGMGAGARP